MTTRNIILGTFLILLICGIGISCTNLNAKVYSVVPNSEFWQTPAEVAAGIAPAYAALDNIPYGDLELVAASSDEMVIPIRGADWLDGNQHTQEWQHTWTSSNPSMNGMWSDIYGGVGKANFTLSIVNSLPTKFTCHQCRNKGVEILFLFPGYGPVWQCPLRNQFQCGSQHSNQPSKTPGF